MCRVCIDKNVLRIIMTSSFVYSKYLHCLFFFFMENDFATLFTKIEPVLNDSTNLYYNYVQYNDELRAKKLFERIFDLYTEEQSNRVYACMWTLIHTIPFLMKKNNMFVNYFYKSFVVSKTECINCIMHYITCISELSDEEWNISDNLFNFTINLHNEINENLEKEEKNITSMKTHYEHMINETLNHKEIVVCFSSNLQNLVTKSYDEVYDSLTLIDESCEIYYFDEQHKKQLLAKLFKNKLQTKDLKTELVEYMVDKQKLPNTYKVNHGNNSNKVYTHILEEMYKVNPDYKRQDHYHTFYNTNTHCHQDSHYQEYGSVFVIKSKNLNGLFVMNNFGIFFNLDESDLLIFDKSKFHYNVCDKDLSEFNFRFALNFT